MVTIPAGISFNQVRFSSSLQSGDNFQLNSLSIVTHCVNSVLFDGMQYNWTGYSSAAGTDWSGVVNYSYYSGNVYNASEYNSLGSPSPYTINNATRIATGGIFGAGTSTPYWIFTNVSISDSVPIAISGLGDCNFQVTGIITDDYNGTAYQCFVLNYTTSWAYYEVNTGVLIQGYFQYNDLPVQYYTINLAATNVEYTPPTPALASISPNPNYSG
ncbi:MAG TPA: hypothetical protein VKK79_25035, partial [Candidatus Lokiarchaeia archaeon]|nr:hypothetical protein [Candidatus Lokiarchaeia archaeon]